MACRQEKQIANKERAKHGQHARSISCLFWLISLMCILQFASVGIAETFLKDYRS